MCRGRRRRDARQRGVAAVELALVTPLIFGIAGAIITFGLVIHARVQMIEMTHLAARMCAASLPSSISRVSSCVTSQLNHQLAAVNFNCTPVIGPTNIQQLPIYIPYQWQIYSVTASLSCSYSNIGLPLLQFLAGGAPTAVTISAQATAPFIPGSN